MPNHLVSPHGGRFTNLMAEAGALADLKRTSRTWHAWELTPRQLCDLELLMSGSYSPLRGFMNRKDYESVCERMHLYNESLWPIPIVLDVPEEMAAKVEPGTPLVLRDAEGVMLAYVDVGEKWKADRYMEAETVYGTTDRAHPGVRRLLEETHPWYVGGRVVGIEHPRHDDFVQLRLTPSELRRQFIRRGWRKVIGFHTAASISRAQYEMTWRAVREQEANLLIQPVIGPAEDGGIDRYARVRCYQALTDHYPAGTAMLALLPLDTRRAGPRETLWQAIIRKNCGCTHFLADPGGDGGGTAFYSEEDTTEMVRRYQEELGIQVLPARRMVYLEDAGTYVPAEEVPPVQRGLELSEAGLVRRLAEGLDIPRWYTFPEMADELRRAYPPRSRQGITLLFTGLPASGKSTLARTLAVRLREMGGRAVTLLDEQTIHARLCSELGSSLEDQDLGLRRIGFVAAEITRNRGFAVCAPVAPFAASRREFREMIAPLGGFSLIHVSTPLPVCASRDRRGLYGKTAPVYEPPEDADLTLDMSDMTPEEGVQQILLHLQRTGAIAAE